MLRYLLLLAVLLRLAKVWKTHVKGSQRHLSIEGGVVESVKWRETSRYRTAAAFPDLKIIFEARRRGRKKEDIIPSL